MFASRRAFPSLPTVSLICRPWLFVPQLRPFHALCALRQSAPSEAVCDATASTSPSPTSSSSSCPAGTVMTGLNILKNGKDPVALEDEAYPEWLWSLTKPVALEDLPIKKRIRKLRRMHIRNTNALNAKR